MQEGLIYATSVRRIMSLADYIFVAVEHRPDSGEIIIA